MQNLCTHPQETLCSLKKKYFREDTALCWIYTQTTSNRKLDNKRDLFLLNNIGSKLTAPGNTGYTERVLWMKARQF